MNAENIEPIELMQRVVDFFSANGIPYRVVGSIASTIYGEPRFTNDIDIVAELKVEHVNRLCAAFASPEYYVSEAAVRDAVTRRFQFNIIHPASGFKVDVIVPPDTEFTQSEAKRIKRIRSEGEFDAWFASPEDIILNKLIYFKLSEGTSDKHLGDIAGMTGKLKDNLDVAYIDQWSERLGIAREWESAKNWPHRP